MQGKQYALIVVCKQFLDADDYELQTEDSEEWIVDDMFGCATTHSVLHSIPTDLIIFSSLEEIEEFKKDWVPRPWWIVPKEWKVVEVEPVYETKIVGWKVKQRREVMKISKELYTFFKEWLEWAEAGGKDGDVFYNHEGLCSSFNLWCDYEGLAWSYDLSSILKYSGLDVNYPFGEEDFHRRLWSNTQHECPKRLAFVREQIKKYEEE